MPVLPGLVLVLGGVLVWALIEGSALAWAIFAVSAVVTVAGYVLQYTLPGRRMRERGVSSSTLLLAVAFGIVGFFVIPVVGAIVGFVLGIFVVELGRSRDAVAGLDPHQARARGRAAQHGHRAGRRAWRSRRCTSSASSAS